jgi:hypothetical protein
MIVNSKPNLELNAVLDYTITYNARHRVVAITLTAKEIYQNF